MFTLIICVCIVKISIDNRHLQQKQVCIVTMLYVQQILNVLATLVQITI